MPARDGTDDATATDEDAQRTRRALTVLLAGSLVGLLGVYWDIAWHLDKGRDSFFTLPHDLIYTGMAAVLLVTAWALVRDRRRTPAHAGVGRYSLQLGLLVGAIGSLLVLAFGPLDEAWHVAFGEDLTLWGPMHLVGLAGFTLAALGGLIAAVLEDRIAPDGWSSAPWHVIGFATAVVGWLVLHVAEWEYGVPAFPMALHPILLSGLPVLALVLVADLDVHRWAATATALAFTALRGVVHVWLLGTSSLGLAGASRPEIPLLILTGLVVDLAARHVSSGALLGALAAGVTLAANVPINRIDQAYPWTSDIALAATLGGLALGAVAGWAGRSIAQALGPLGPTTEAPDGGGGPSRTSAATLVLLVVLAGLAAPTAMAHPTDPSSVDPIGQADVRTTYHGPDRTASFEIQLTREGVSVTAGTLFTTVRSADGEILAREPVTPGSDGVYRLSTRLPADTDWRMQFYHGYGFRLADGIVEGRAPADIDGGAETDTVPLYSLYPDVPPQLNRWGYAAYGVILAGVLAGVVALLKRIDDAELETTAVQTR